jgi:sulfate adenylyltransferase subunit 1 (EFTu-like GTPase family)
MITGATQAEAAVLIVDTNEGVKEQTRRHAYIISMLGMDKIIAVFNKMDLIGYKEERFEKVKNELLKFFDDLGVKPSYMIPVSAKEGINIAKISSEMKWYKGPSLLRAIDSLRVSIEIKRRPLRLPLQDVYEMDGKKITVGRIISGALRKGQKVYFFPSLKEARIDSIKVFGERKVKARAGESIGLILDEGLFAKRGEVIAAEMNPPKITSRFKARVFWMSDKPLQVNGTVTLRCATQEVESFAEKIEKRINSSTLEIIEKNAKELKANEAGVVIFKTAKPIVVEKFSFIEELGRFIIERDYNLQGAGIITEAIL